MGNQTAHQDRAHAENEWREGKEGERKREIRIPL
jgi:hypothetical protein